MDWSGFTRSQNVDQSNPTTPWRVLLDSLTGAGVEEPQMPAPRSLVEALQQGSPLDKSSFATLAGSNDIANVKQNSPQEQWPEALLRGMGGTFTWRKEWEPAGDAHQDWGHANTSGRDDPLDLANVLQALRR